MHCSLSTKSLISSLNSWYLWNCTPTLGMLCMRIRVTTTTGSLFKSNDSSLNRNRKILLNLSTGQYITEQSSLAYCNTDYRRKPLLVIWKILFDHTTNRYIQSTCSHGLTQPNGPIRMHVQPTHPHPYTTHTQYTTVHVWNPLKTRELRRNKPLRTFRRFPTVSISSSVCFRFPFFTKSIFFFYIWPSAVLHSRPSSRSEKTIGSSDYITIVFFILKFIFTSVAFYHGVYVRAYVCMHARMWVHMCIEKSHAFLRNSVCVGVPQRKNGQYRGLSAIFLRRPAWVSDTNSSENTKHYITMKLGFWRMFEKEIRQTQSARERERKRNNSPCTHKHTHPHAQTHTHEHRCTQADILF